jgi:DNA-binding MarR family transcriptional regulator
MSQLAPLDITYEQFVVLTRLWHQSDLSQTDLADEIFVDKSSLARMLGRMEEAGLIRREVDEMDSRVNRVNLTPKGRALEAEMSPLRRRGLSRATQGMSVEEVHELKRMLNHIFHHISAGDS